MFVLKMLAMSPKVQGSPDAPLFRAGSFHTFAHTHLPNGLPSKTSILVAAAPLLALLLPLAARLALDKLAAHITCVQWQR